MITKPENQTAGSRAFLWVALATGLILLIPLTAMQFTAEVNWDGFDFLVMGALLFGMGSLFVLVSRKVPRRVRLLSAGAFLLAFLYLWAELAVGIFTSLGS